MKIKFKASTIAYMINTAQQLLSTAAGEQWRKIGVRHHHGIVVPLFSLHSQKSCGIGEYLDLLPLIAWCQQIGLDTIQLLPLNDTGLDTSPYCALSANALNPIHLSLSQLPHAVPSEELQALQMLTNKTQRVDYKTLHREREAFLRNYYRQYGPQITSQEDYQRFKERHAAWLPDYALFKALKIRFNWKGWEKWPSPFNHRVSQLPSDLQAEAEYHIFLQYLCFFQFAEVKRSAEQHAVFLKGDIPILINKESADVWAKRHLFLLDLVAGAPPDHYSKEGQKWGFPLYNWREIAAEEYHWWKTRLAVASQLYHIYRIDHIVGFFRIWAIPLSLPAKEGHFVPENEQIWVTHGKAIMDVMLAASPMLPIGEDLGTVPPEARACLRSLGICGTKVMRWERRWEEDKSFIDPKDYPPESMTTVSTHDSETLALWWKKQPSEARLYAQSLGWNYAPELTSQQRLFLLQQSHSSGSLFHINLLQEYLALVPGMTWPKLEDERINWPGTVSDKNWSYRFCPSVEEIVESPLLRQHMDEMIG